MTTPAQAAVRLGLSLLWGIGLGVYYGFLRPLRPKHTVLSDLLFLPALLWAWLQVCFGICGGDIRLGYLAGLPLGAFAWELTVGKALRPVFELFWRAVGTAWRILFWPMKKFFRILW